MPFDNTLISFTFGNSNDVDKINLLKKLNTELLTDLIITWSFQAHFHETATRLNAGFLEVPLLRVGHFPSFCTIQFSRRNLNLQPDILVKGGDYQLHEIVGREVVEARGGQVLALPFVAGYSTSALIKRIRSSR